MWNILLQILDEGRLTDMQGRTINFTNTIVVLTSNLGATRDPTLSKAERRARIDMAIAQTLRPELINRIDAIVHFDPLKEEDVARIAVARLNDAKRRLAAQNIYLEWSDAVVAELGRVGFDSEMGTLVYV